MKKFLESNEPIYRLIRTIAQAIIGVVVANLDTIIGTFTISEVWKPIIVAFVMAVLSPIMAELGKRGNNEKDIC